jgi:hypothetical protein
MAKTRDFLQENRIFRGFSRFFGVFAASWRHSPFGVRLIAEKKDQQPCV